MHLHFSEQSAVAVTSEDVGEDTTMESDDGDGDVMPTSTPLQANVVTLEDCSQAYFAGYLAHNHFKKYKCLHCLKKMSNISSELKSKKELLILNRSFSTFKVDITSGLLSPSESLSYVVDCALKVYKLKFRNMSHKENIVANLISLTTSMVSLDSVSCSDQKCQEVCKNILRTLFRTLIHKQCKWISTSIKSSSYNKLKILKNI